MEVKEGIGYVYMTIDLTNGKKYIGKDYKLIRGYLGSGTLLKRAIEKRGENNFKRINLFSVYGKKSLVMFETHIIKLLCAAQRDDYYNISNNLDTINNQGVVRRVFCYDDKGCLVHVFYNSKAAAKYFKGGSSSVNRACREDGATAYGHYFKYDRYDKLPEHLMTHRKTDITRDRKPKKVYKYSKNGDYLGEYDSICEAAKSHNMYHGQICAVLTGRVKTAGGFYWSIKKIKGDVNTNVSEIVSDVIKHSLKKTVVISNEDNELIDVYDSVSSAAKHIGLSKGYIATAARDGLVIGSGNNKYKCIYIN